jgi:hypothetical protein
MQLKIAPDDDDEESTSNADSQDINSFLTEFMNNVVVSSQLTSTENTPYSVGSSGTAVSSGLYSNTADVSRVTSQCIPTADNISPDLANALNTLLMFQSSGVLQNLASCANAISSFVELSNQLQPLLESNLANTQIDPTLQLAASQSTIATSSSSAVAPSGYNDVSMFAGPVGVYNSLPDMSVLASGTQTLPIDLDGMLSLSDAVLQETILRSGMNETTDNPSNDAGITTMDQSSSVSNNVGKQDQIIQTDIKISSNCCVDNSTLTSKNHCCCSTNGCTR